MPVFLWGINPVFPGERLLRLGHLQSMLEEGRRKLSATAILGESGIPKTGMNTLWLCQHSYEHSEQLFFFSCCFSIENGDFPVMLVYQRVVEAKSQGKY